MQSSLHANHSEQLLIFVKISRSDFKPDSLAPLDTEVRDSSKNELTQCSWKFRGKVFEYFQIVNKFCHTPDV